MKTQEIDSSSKLFSRMPKKQIYYKLIALWVVCEALLGGIIHGLKLPVSGLIVGSAATICICLIGYYYPLRGAILKATIIVAIFKMMLSPQSPFPAYIAVFFQGLFGELIFFNKKSYRLNCFLLGVITLVESGLQRLLVMTVLFGMDIWKAINVFIQGITGEKNLTNYSLYLASIYVILHFITGLFVGWIAGKIPMGSEEFLKNDKFLIPVQEDESVLQPSTQKKKTKWMLIIIYLLVLIFYLQSMLMPEHALLSPNIILKLIVRSSIILLTWVLIINPFLTRQLHRWLNKKRSTTGEDIKEITRLIPSTQNLIVQSWKLSSHKQYLKRLILFARIVVFNSLRYE